MKRNSQEKTCRYYLIKTWTDLTWPDLTWPDLFLNPVTPRGLHYLGVRRQVTFTAYGMRLGWSSVWGIHSPSLSLQSIGTTLWHFFDGQWYLPISVPSSIFVHPPSRLFSYFLLLKVLYYFLYITGYFFSSSRCFFYYCIRRHRRP